MRCTLHHLQSVIFTLYFGFIREQCISYSHRGLKSHPIRTIVLKRVFAILMLFTLWGVELAVAQSVALNGSASSLGGGCYSVTPNQQWQNGAVWYTTPLNLSNPFTLEFTMNFGSNDSNGADGMVFVFQTQGVNALGIDGGGMGYGGFNPSFGIEFDTFQNNNPGAPNDDNSDPPFDHIAFHRNGNVNHSSPNNLAGPVQASAVSQNIEDNLPHNVRITWNPVTQMVSCYFDCALRLSHTIDLINGIFSGQTQVTFGFTGSTGFYFNAQSVCISDFVLTTTNPSPICPGQSVPLSAGGTGAGTYSWSPATGLSNPNAQSTSASPASTTTYTVTHTNICGLTTTAEVTVEVSESPPLEVIPDISICPGGTGILSAQLPQNPTQINWTTSGGAIVGPTSQAEITVGSAGIYTLSVTNAQGCVSQASAVVTEFVPPAFFIPENQYAICPGGSISLTASNGSYSHIWQPSGSSDLTQSFNTPGNYQLVYQWQGCTTSYPFGVTTVVLSNLDLGPDQFICEAQPVTLNAGVVVNWSTGVTASTITVNQSGTYSYTYTQQGCTASDQITIVADAMPAVELGGPYGLCAGQNLILDIPYTGQWSNGEVGSSINITGAGNYGVSVANGLCIATDAAVVNVLLDPVADLGEDARYCLGDVVTLSAVHPANESVLWEDGSTSPIRTITDSGIYSVLVENSCGMATATVSLVFEDCDVFIYIPNAFSPDNDGVNDAWKPVVHNIDAYEVWIYDRWGTEIFYTSDPSRYWLGNVRGGEHYVPSGAYVYRFIYDKSASEKEELRGWVVVR